MSIAVLQTGLMTCCYRSSAMYFKRMPHSNFAASCLTDASIDIKNVMTSRSCARLSLQYDAGKRLSAFIQEQAANVSLFDWQNFRDEQLRRKFRFMAYIGVSALNTDDYKAVEGTALACAHARHNHTVHCITKTVRFKSTPKF